MNVDLTIPPTDVPLAGDNRAIKQLSINQLANPTSDQPDSFNHRFDNILNNLLNHVNNTQLTAENQMVALESGKDNLIETVLAIQKASQTMNMMIQVRNRLVEGYQEVFSQQI